MTRCSRCGAQASPRGLTQLLCPGCLIASVLESDGDGDAGSQDEDFSEIPYQIVTLIDRHADSATYLARLAGASAHVALRIIGPRPDVPAILGRARAWETALAQVRDPQSRGCSTPDRPPTTVCTSRRSSSADLARRFGVPRATDRSGSTGRRGATRRGDRGAARARADAFEARHVAHQDPRPRRRPRDDDRPRHGVDRRRPCPKPTTGSRRAGIARVRAGSPVTNAGAGECRREMFGSGAGATGLTRAPWWVLALAASFFAYFALLGCTATCGARRTPGSRPTTMRTGWCSPGSRQARRLRAPDCCPTTSSSPPTASRSRRTDWTVIDVHVAFDSPIALTITRGDRRLVTSLNVAGAPGAVLEYRLGRVPAADAQRPVPRARPGGGHRAQTTDDAIARIRAGRSPPSACSRSCCRDGWRRRRELPVLASALLWIPHLSDLAAGAVLFTFFSNRKLKPKRRQ